MRDLSEHLLNKMEESLSNADDASKSAWVEISQLLREDAGLEAALSNVDYPDSLANIISSEISKCILDKEQAAITSLLNSTDTPPLGRLFQHILSNNSCADVVTTNYDRLIEISSACAEVRVDTMFYGHTLGRINATLSREELFQLVTQPGQPRKIEPRVRPHIRLSKPHGSLDWFDRQGSSVRSDIPIENKRQIITPGNAKYRAGYEDIFAQHRTRAVNAIREAKAFLMIGYGFNDDHLEEQMKYVFPSVPAVILARNLTENAKKYLVGNESAVGLQESDTGGTLVVQGGNTLNLDTQIWRLDDLLKEVLRK